MWQFFQNLNFPQISSIGGVTSVVYLIQVGDNLTFQLLFTFFQDEARHLHEIEKASLVVSFLSVHCYTLIPEFMKTKIKTKINSGYMLFRT